MYDVEIAIHFESAHSVPKMVKFLHFVTSLRITYDGHFLPLDECVQCRGLWGVVSDARDTDVRTSFS